MTQQATSGQTPDLMGMLSGGWNKLVGILNSSGDDEEGKKRREAAMDLWRKAMASGGNRQEFDNSINALNSFQITGAQLDDARAEQSVSRTGRLISMVGGQKEKMEDNKLGRDLTRMDAETGHQRTVLDDFQGHERDMLALQLGSGDKTRDAYLEGERMRLNTIKELAEMQRPSGLQRILGPVAQLAGAIGSFF